MGLFDEIVVEHPLPDGFDATGVVFQTKESGAWGFKTIGLDPTVDDLKADLRRWSEWLASQAPLPPDAEDLLARTRALLKTQGGSPG